MAYDAILQVKAFRIQKYPLKVNDGMIKLLTDGVLYVYGRDKFFRPLLYVNAGKFQQLR